MSLANPPAQHPAAAVLACYNAVPNVLWSVLAFGPLVGCCCCHVKWPWLWGFVAVSLSAWLRRLQMSSPYFS